MPEAPEVPPSRPSIRLGTPRQLSESLGTLPQGSVKIDVGGVDSMLPAQAALTRLGEQLNRFLEGISLAMAQIDWAAVARAWERAKPANWEPLSLSQWERLPEVAFGDGIPIAWVPRRELLTQLLSAADRAERIQLLVEHESVILADCAACLEECTESSLADEVTMAVQALRAFQDGHAEAAQSHAVSVANGLITAIVEEYQPGASTLSGGASCPSVRISSTCSRLTNHPWNRLDHRGGLPSTTRSFGLGDWALDSGLDEPGPRRGVHAPCDTLYGRP